MRVLVAEDERIMRELLREGLSEEGHVVTVAATGTDALELARSAEFDAILLDVMLPGLDGFAVARCLRQERNRTPILMLTARDTDRDMIAGLNAGADDYVTKPFSFEVLLARLRAVTRRGPVSHAPVMRIADLEVDPARHSAMRAGRELALTRREFAILELLVRNAGRVVSRETIFEVVWGHTSDVEDNTLDAFMRLLRSKVELPGEAKLIQTVRGVGYAVREEPA